MKMGLKALQGVRIINEIGEEFGVCSCVFFSHFSLFQIGFNDESHKHSSETTNHNCHHKRIKNHHNYGPFKANHRCS